MKNLALVFLMVLMPLLVAGCQQVPSGGTQSNETEMNQEMVQEISTAEDDVTAADAALDATEQALDELESIDFGEAPAVE